MFLVDFRRQAKDQSAAVINRDPERTPLEAIEEPIARAGSRDHRREVILRVDIPLAAVGFPHRGAQERNVECERGLDDQTRVRKHIGF